MAMTTTSVLGYDTAAYNKLMWFDLRLELYFDDCADVGTTPFTHKGSSVQFNFLHDLAAATTPLTETTDVTSVAMDDDVVTITLDEYGNAVETTAKLNHTSFIDLDPGVASVIGYNAGVSQDVLARDKLVAGSNVRYGGAITSRATVAAATTITSANIRRARVDLVNAGVPSFDGWYRAYIHPDVAYDLKAETGDTGWRVPQNNVFTDGISRGTLGYYEGFQFIETPRAGMVANAGVGSTVDVYQTLFVGRQALAKAYTNGTHTDGQAMGGNPIVIKGPVTDKLQRFVPMGWYWFGNYGVFRQEALRRLETSSSIGANT